MIIEIDPLPKPRQTQRDRWIHTKKNLSPSDQKHLNRILRYRAFADELRCKCNLLGYKLQDELSISFTIAMPKSWSKKKKAEMDGKPHQQTPDLDNLCKSFQDVLAADDSHVHRISANKVWGYEGLIHILPF